MYDVAIQRVGNVADLTKKFDNVSAKDMGTGNEQKITITASTNLSDEDIDKAVKEAEKYAEEDKKKKEAIEAKNQADSLVYQSEKALEEMKDKISEEEKASITAEIEKVKAAITTDNTEEIKASTEALQKVFYEISAKMYQQAQGQAGAEPGANEANGEVVDED